MTPETTTEAPAVSAWRRLAARAMLCGGLGMAAGLAGTMLDPVESQLGPHRAEVTTTFDQYDTIDAGPIGALRQSIGSRTLPLGVHLDIKEPAVGSPLAVQGDSAANEQLLRQYVGLLDTKVIARNIEDIRTGLERRFIFYGLAGVAAGFLATRTRARAQARLPGVATRRQRFLPIVLAGSLLTVGSSPSQQDSLSWQPVSGVFADTPLKNMQVAGAPLQLALNNYGPRAVEFWHQTEDFYAEAANSTAQTLASALPAKIPDGHARALFISDNHCNIGMGQVYESVIKSANPSLVIDSGDTAMGVLPYEGICIDSLYSQFGKLSIAATLGNHDAPSIADAMRQNKAVVMNGKAQTVAGVTFLGVPDPRQTVIGQGTSLRESSMTMDSAAQNLLAAACSEQQKTGREPLILVHASQLADLALRGSCATDVLAGHKHVFSAEQVSDWLGSKHTVLTNGTSGGAAENSFTPGPLKAPGVMALLDINTATNRLAGYRTISIMPDATVWLGSATSVG